MSGKTAAELAQMIDGGEADLSSVAEHLNSRKKVRYPSRILLLAIEQKHHGSKGSVSDIMKQIMDAKRSEGEERKSAYKMLQGAIQAASKTPPDTDAVDVLGKLSKFLHA